MKTFQQLLKGGGVEGGGYVEEDGDAVIEGDERVYEVGAVTI